MNENNEKDVMERAIYADSFNTLVYKKFLDKFGGEGVMLPDDVKECIVTCLHLVAGDLAVFSRGLSQVAVPKMDVGETIIMLAIVKDHFEELKKSIKDSIVAAYVVTLYPEFRPTEQEVQALFEERLRSRQ